MKLNLRAGLLLLGSVALLYTGCKKTSNSPAPAAATISADEASVAIGQNLMQSLNGSLGGASVSDGVNVSPKLTSSTSKLKVQALNVQCGFYADSSLDLTYQTATSKSHVTGNLKYFFICNNGNSIGYDLRDSISTKGYGPGYTFAYATVQDYHVRGLNSNNSNFSLDGTIQTYVDNEYAAYPANSASIHDIFTFKDLYVHGDDNFDITSGTGTFESKGKKIKGAWDYSGTIVFLGNHKAKFTFLSKVYLIDLITGKVTPA